MPSRNKSTVEVPAITTNLWSLIAPGGAKPPRIHVLSDVHLDHGPYMLPTDLEYDILVAPGDMGTIEDSIAWLKSLNKPVIYVLGNHEYYGLDLEAAVRLAKALATGSQVHVLNRDSVVIQGVRFLGATLWPSFGNWNPYLVWEALRRMGDYGNIHAGTWRNSTRNEAWLKKYCKRANLLVPEQTADEPSMFHPAMAYQEHLKTVNWLERELEKAPKTEPVVVVTHHAPTLESLRAAGIKEAVLDPANWGTWMRDEEMIRPAAYACQLDELLRTHREKISLWAHGHIHEGLDLLVEGVRVVCNPRGRTIAPLTVESAKAYSLFGFRLTQKDIDRSQAIAAENPFRGDAGGFERDLVVDLEDGLCRPIRLITEKHLPVLIRLRQSVSQYLPYVFAGEARQQQAVIRAIADDCRLFRAELEVLHSRVSRQLDPFFSTPIIRRLSGPIVEPHEPWENPLRGPLKQGDYDEIVTLMDDWITWAEKLHLQPKEAMVLWASRAYCFLASLRAAGIDATIRRPTAWTLRTVANDHIVAFTKLDYDSCAELESKAYEEINEKIKLRWCPSVWCEEDVLEEGGMELPGLTLAELKPWDLGLPLLKLKRPA